MTKLKYAGRCPCGKVSYPTRKDAKEGRKRLKGGGKSMTAVGIYVCDESPYFHLGHMNTGVRAGHVDPDSVYGATDERTEADQLTDAREAVIARSKGRCEVCGGRGTEFSHRRTRGVTGAHRHCSDNALWSCSPCHKEMHDHPEEARRLGRHVSRYQPEPFRVPVWLQGGWWLLHCNGQMSFYEGSN